MHEVPFSIYDYTDFREALRDFFAIKKRQNPRFSHRALAQRLGFKSSGFFSMIIKGTTSISADTIIRFANFMQLGSHEATYFELLVRYNQAQKEDVKEHLHRKLLSCRQTSATILKEDQHAFFREWYHPVVREILDYYPYRGDYRALARMVQPAIAPEEAKKSIELLERLGLIIKNEDGSYSRTDRHITTGTGLSSQETKSFARKMLMLASDALDRAPADERTASWLTMSIAKENYPRLLDEIRSFRKRLRELSETDTDTDTVYQLNMQFFPCAKTVRKSSGEDTHA
jgi:uncharacterized protein (TIGR02147 family)